MLLLLLMTFPLVYSMLEIRMGANSSSPEQLNMLSALHHLYEQTTSLTEPTSHCFGWSLKRCVCICYRWAQMRSTMRPVSLI